MKEMVGGCCVCSDDRGWAENPLVYCDGQGCTVAVHQACYGIVTVPTGNWYCRKCESQERSVRILAMRGPRQHCELCPSRDGALKRTDNSGWAHVVCALYIPEVRFGNVTTMEPILLQQIPAERFSKVCYICEESGKGTRSTIGACMQCNKSGCKQQFHVTCAQTLGLLCEEAGNYLDNVKYCGYCQHHYSKLKKGGNVKTIPPYRPVTVENSDVSSPEKEPSENWTKTSAKRKPSTNSSKNNAATPSSGTKSATTAIKSDTNPGPSVIAEPAAPTPADEIPTVTPPPPVSTTQVKDLMLTNTKSDPASSGKFTTSNFVESVVTPSDSVFGDTGKPGKKRKSQSVQPVKEDTAVQPSSVISTNTSVAPTVDDNNKRLRVEPLVPVVRTESPTPSVVVRIQTTSPPSTSPSLTPPITRAAVATSSPLTVTSSIVVSVPLTAAAIPPNTVTTTPASPATPVEEEPAKRGRSQSSEKPDKGRKQKRGTSTTVGSTAKRGSRSNQVSPPSVQVPATVSPQMTTMAPIVPTTATTTTTSVVTHSSTTPSPLVKESLSPPSSPETSRRSVQRTRKQPTPNQPPPSRDDRDTRLFQNGVSAPHMLGNQLNPASTMAQKMSDTLNQELEAHSIFTSEANLSTGQLIGPQLHSRVIATARSAGSGSSANSTPHSSATPPAVPTASTSTTLGVNWGGPNANITPQTLDQLLERQWEQGSQFLMEQAQHFDIASLLSCLHQLRAENLRLEEHVSSLLQRRDHLLAVNARLAIPLIPTTPIVNNIHPATTAAVDTTRSTSSQSGRINNSYMSQPGSMPLENGPPPSPPSQQQYHRTPVTQPSPNTATRHHSPGSSQGYVMHPTSTASGPGVVVRGGSSVPTDPLRTDARRSSSQSSSSHQQGYPAMYQVPTQQPQIVMRREVADLHHQNSSSKPS